MVLINARSRFSQSQRWIYEPMEESGSDLSNPWSKWFQVNPYPGWLVPRSNCPHKVHLYMQWRSQLVTSHLVTSLLYNNYWWKLVPKHILYQNVEVYIYLHGPVYVDPLYICLHIWYYASDVQLDGQKM